jgi:hypothetical protein
MNQNSSSAVLTSLLVPVPVPESASRIARERSANPGVN